MRSTFLLLGLVLAASGCSRDGGDDGEVCHEAADLCGAGGGFDEEDCRGDQQAYAACIVDRGDCEPATLVECADDSASGPDGGPGGDAAIELTVTTFTDSGVGLVDVAFSITNVGESDPIPVASTYFQIEDEAANLHLPSGGVCFGGELLATGGSEDCELQFTIGVAAPVALMYRDGQGRDAEASLEGICSGGGENTQAACSDGCSNDDDSYIDCEDYDCCDLVACGPGTACGDR